AGVAVYFNLKGKLQVVPCDEYLTVAENMRAIQYVVEALRTIERHGGTGVFSTAFSGFQALPAKGETTGARWWDILEVSQDATLQEVQAAFFKLSKVYHPDVPGGSHEKMAALTEARKQALEILSSSQNSLN
ncbi:MAG: J domain-containing protein, partial [Rufibacter sp.]